MITTWVLFVWMTAGSPIAVWNFDSKEECEMDAKAYKRHACVKVVLPRSAK